MNPFDLWLDCLVPAMFLAAFAPAIFYGWRMVKALVYGLESEELDAAADSARELRLSQSRIRRLRTARYADEHSAWSAEFAALGGGCSCHGAPAARRSASRYVPYL